MSPDSFADVPLPVLRTAGTGPASLEQFLAGVAAHAFRFAELGLRHRDDALDAVQDTMARMLRYGDRPASEWTPLFWSVLRSRVVDQQRRRTFRLRWLSSPVEEDTVDWTDHSPDPARSQEGRQAWSRAAAALSALPRRQREAFTLRVLEELDVATTARAMGCSEGSVKTHLSRARDAAAATGGLAMNHGDEDDATGREEAFDRRLRDAYSRAVAQVSPRTRAQLQQRQRIAGRPVAPHRWRSLPGWTMATAVALLLVAGLRWHESRLPESTPASDELAVLDAPDTNVAVLEENPDFYLWLSSDDAIALASE